MKTVSTLLFFFVIFGQATVRGQHACDDFSFTNCNIDDNLIWENGLIETDEKCQMACQVMSACKFFFFDAGTCRLYR